MNMKDKYVYPRPISTSMSPGMELRDWFAGQVLQASCRENSPYDAARSAYEYADAMMEIRNEEQN
jgi:hypothetical protein